MNEPVELSERSIQNLTSAITAATRGAPGAGVGGTGASTASGFSSSGAFNLFNDGLNGSIGALRSFTTGTFSATKALDTFGGFAGHFGPAGQALGNFTTGLGKGFIDVNDSLRTASQNGVYVGQNLGLYDRAVLGSRMSLSEMNDTIRTSNQSLNGLAGNMDKSTLTYLKMSKDLQDNPLTYNLAATGMGLDEFNKITLTSASMRKNLDLSSASGQRAVIESSMAMAVEFDNVSRLTGKSRVAMQKEMDDFAQKTSTKLLMATLSPEQQAAVEQTKLIAGAYGKSTERAAEIIATGGPRSAEESKQVAAVDPKVRGLLEQLSKVEGNGPEAAERRKQIKMQLDLEAERIASNKDDLRTKVSLARSGDKQAEAIAENTADMLIAGQRVQKDRIEADKQGLSLQDFRNKQEKIKVDQITGKGTPAEQAAAAPARTINQAEILTKDISKGVAEGFNSLNKELGEQIKNTKALNEVLRPFTGAEIKGVAKKIIDSTSSPGRVDTSNSANVPADMKNLIPKTDGRQEGSFGAVGKFMEDFGAGKPMMLHGKEGVITEKQFNGLFGDMSKQLSGAMPDPKQIQGMLGGMTGGLKTDLEKAKASMPTTDTFEKMFSQMKLPNMGELTKPSGSAPVSSSANSGSDAINDVAKGVNELNMRIERLITAVTDGSDKNVRALKAGGNVLAS
ncbi:hypothetical protein UFOVP181_343 [uncultured Caudovirales phage]|uniref:Uncharacterized protein n=1 Tax=uncultured Caudovirales phage TaxID=2100421 RepID=A0A6J7WHY6_9CAUD|nr:hypothetical protein UFOVP57_296 [uncultured Caudovirales phage]CAB5209166.1 hypothetical protein UFOVP181_343 [uncultured Caudovirales phage]